MKETAIRYAADEDIMSKKFMPKKNVNANFIGVVLFNASHVL